eukprot:296546-Amorphochlora_amoeboformis.AAC.1
MRILPRMLRESNSYYALVEFILRVRKLWEKGRERGSEIRATESERGKFYERDVEEKGGKRESKKTFNSFCKRHLQPFPMTPLSAFRVEL